MWKLSQLTIASALLLCTALAFAKEPATVREAVKIIDLSRLPIPKEARIEFLKLANVKYVIRGTVFATFKRHREQLVDAGFLPESAEKTTEESARGFYVKEGFRIELDASPATEDGTIRVQIRNLGNFHPQEMPDMPNSKVLKNDNLRRLLTVPGEPEKVAKEFAEHVGKLGWTPLPKPRLWYEFKKNGVKLQATFLTDRDDPKRSAVDLRCEQLSGVLSAPENVELMNLPETSRAVEIGFFTAMAPKTVFDFYRKSLGKDGWEAKTKEPEAHPGGGVCSIFTDRLLGVIRVTVNDASGRRRVMVEQFTDADWSRVLESQELFRKSRK